MRKLESTYTLKDITVKNRFLRSATMENMADYRGYVTDALLKVYYDLARGGVGLIVTGAAAVDPAGQGMDNQMAAWDASHVEGLSKIAEIVHRFGDGCICAVQLHYAAVPGRGQRKLPTGGIGLVTAQEPEIKNVIDAFAVAAARTRKAGFDAVAIHGGHGYALQQFLSPVANTRSDDWGGSPDRRMKFAVEVCRSVRKAVGSDMPILLKMNCEDYTAGGLTVSDTAPIAARLVEEGVDLVEISGGVKDMTRLRNRLKKEAGEKEAYFLNAVESFRKAIGDKALALTGGIRSIAVMERLVENGVDFVGLSRPLICEPDLPDRLLKTTDMRRARCTSCNKCSVQIVNQPVKCAEFDEFRQVLKTL